MQIVPTSGIADDVDVGISRSDDRSHGTVLGPSAKQTQAGKKWLK